MSEIHEATGLQAPHVKWTKYVIVAVVLAVITGLEITVALGHFLPQGLTAIVLIGLTLSKAALVMLFYMHLKYETKWYSLVLVFPLFMVVVLFSVVLIAAASWNIV